MKAKKRVELARRVKSVVSGPNLRHAMAAAGYSDYVDLLKHPNPPALTEDRMSSDVDLMFDMGGVVSGGMALSCYTGKFDSKDADFYINDDKAYIEAWVRMFENPMIDVCMYFDEPHELHDIGVVMVNMTKEGFFVTDECRSALDTGVSSLFPESVIHPVRTLERMRKYKDRLGIRYKAVEVLTLGAMYLDMDSIGDMISF